MIDTRGDLTCRDPKYDYESDTYSLGITHAATCNGRVGAALRPSGQVIVWAPHREPIAMKGLADVVELAGNADTNWQTACAVRAGGTVSCFDAIEKDDKVVVGAIVTVPGIADAFSITSSGDHYCALRRTGETHCYDYAPGGYRGNPAQVPTFEVKPIEGLRDVAALALEAKFACAAHRDGSVSCWGSSNEHGQLGSGDLSPRASPTPVRGLSDVIDVETSDDRACAIRRNGEVLCWGSNGGRLAGQDEPAGHETPVRVLFDE